MENAEGIDQYTEIIKSPFETRDIFKHIASL